MIRCQSCGSQNLDGSQFCDECGTKLSASGGAAAVERQPGGLQPQFRTSDARGGAAADANAFQSGNITSVGIPSIVEIIKEADQSIADARRGRGQGIHSTLKIERGEAIGVEFPLSAAASYIGRWDADNGVFPDVDLDAHDREAKVSRRHARILYEDGRFAIEDLGSTNGTYVNRGRRLIPGAAQPLKDGDEIIVGKTFMRFSTNA